MDYWEGEFWDADGFGDEEGRRGCCWRSWLFLLASSFEIVHVVEGSCVVLRDIGGAHLLSLDASLVFKSSLQRMLLVTVSLKKKSVTCVVVTQNYHNDEASEFNIDVEFTSAEDDVNNSGGFYCLIASICFMVQQALVAFAATCIMHFQVLQVLTMILVYLLRIHVAHVSDTLLGRGWITDEMCWSILVTKSSFFRQWSPTLYSDLTDRNACHATIMYVICS